MKTPQLQFHKAKDGWRWRLRARNGRIVAESGEAYSNRRKLRRGLNTTLTAIHWAEIVTLPITQAPDKPKGKR